VRTILVSLILLVFLPAAQARVRHYYIAAEDCSWDYAPSGQDLIDGRPIPALWTQRTKWQKSRFFEYTDSTFTVRKPQPEWLGILGPIIRAEVGDEVIVDFLNRTSRPHSIHPHGLRYDKDNEGAYYIPVAKGGLVPPRDRYTYHWFADSRSGPGPGQPSSVVWWYHPHVDSSVEINLGLLGPIIVTAQGKAKPDGSPKDVDEEFVAAFMIFDELNGRNEGLFHAINGYIFGNLPGFDMKMGERVRWHVMGMGNEKDLHTPHWHGERLTDGSRNLDVVSLLPASTVSVDMIADNPGTWMFHCHVADHMESGMMAWYTIYEPHKAECPLQVVNASFYDGSGKFSITVKNVGAKPIQRFAMTAEHLLAPEYLRRPFDSLWNGPQPLQPGQQETIEQPAYKKGADAILAWVLSPHDVLYADGSRWAPKDDHECYQVFWREKEHPDLKVLPPLQVELKED